MQFTSEEKFYRAYVVIIHSKPHQAPGLKISPTCSGARCYVCMYKALNLHQKPGVKMHALNLVPGIIPHSTELEPGIINYSTLLQAPSLKIRLVPDHVKLGS
jgi:hypothetical protein